MQTYSFYIKSIWLLSNHNISGIDANVTKDIYAYSLQVTVLAQVLSTQVQEHHYHQE